MSDDMQLSRDDTPGSTVVATLHLFSPASDDGCNVLRVVSATGGIHACAPISETDPSVLGPVAQRIQIDVHAHCPHPSALMSLLDLLGKLKPGVEIRRQVLRVEEGSADALVILPPKPRQAEVAAAPNGLAVHG